MKTTLSTTLTQRQTLTAEQIATIKLLHLPCTALQAEVTLALKSNPLVVSGSPESVDNTADKASDSDNAPYTVRQDSDFSSPFDNIAANTDFKDELLAEARCLALDAGQSLLLTCLIDELNDHGLLSAPLGEIIPQYAHILDQEGFHDITGADWKKALNILQSFEPVGIGAESPTAALLMQISRLRNDGVISAKRAEALGAIVKNGLGDVARHDCKNLERLTGLDEKNLAPVLNTLATLHPYPVDTVGNALTQYIVPDIVVVETDDGPKATINPAVDYDIRLADRAQRSVVAKEYGKTVMQDHLSEARLLIAALQARRSTLLRTAQAAIDRQYLFFTNGEIALEPLNLKDIAQTLSIAESTVSRALSGKFFLCRRGMFDFKTLFPAACGVNNPADGNAASATRICAFIREIVLSEDPAHPLSDEAIRSRLQSYGLSVARRTVAKYRESLGIASTRLRRQRS